MSRGTVNHGMGKQTGILLLLITISLIQSQNTVVLTGQKRINATYEFSNVTSGNGTNLRKIDQQVDAKSFAALNKNNNGNEHNDDVERTTPFQFFTTSPSVKNRKSLSSTQDLIAVPTKLYKIDSTINDKLLLQDKKLDDISKRHLFKQLLATIPRSSMYNEEHQNILVTHMDDHDNNNKELLVDNEKKLSNDTEPTTPTTKLRDNDRIISPVNNTIANYSGINIKQMDDVVMMKSTTIQAGENATNGSSKYSNIVTNINGLLGILENVTTLSKDTMIIGIDDDKHLLMPSETTMINNTTTNMTNDTELFVTISMSKNKHNVSSTNHTIAFSETHEFSDVADQQFDVIEEVKFYPHVNNNNNNTNVLKNSSDEISLLENTINKSHVNEKLIITESSIVINDNSIQQMKTPLFSEKFENSSVINDKKFPKISENVTISQPQNVSNSLIFGLDVKSNVTDISREVGSINGSIGKRSSLDLNDNGLYQVMEQNSEKSELTADMTAIKNFSDVTTRTNESNDSSLSNNPLDIGDSTFTISPINIMEDSTNSPQLFNTYASSISSSFLSARNFSSTLSSTSIPQMLATFDVDASTSVTTITKEYDVTTFKSATTSVNSSWQAIDVVPTTVTNIEYEFIELSGTTDWVNNNANSSDYGIKLNVNATSIAKLNATVPSFIHEFSIENEKNRLNNSFTVGKSTINDSSTTTDFLNINDSISTSDDIHTDTSTYSTVRNLDTYGVTAVTDESTTSLSHTATFIFYPSSTLSPITAIDGEGSTVTDTIREPITSDAIITTTSTATTMMSPSSIFDFGNEAETSSTIIDLAITSNVEDTTTISTIHITNDMTRLLPEDVTVLVRIVVETSSSDVCPQLTTIRDALADVLSAGVDKTVLAQQIIFQKNPCADDIQTNGNVESTELPIPMTLLLYVVDLYGNFDPNLTKILPKLYRKSPLKLNNVSIRSFQLVEDADSGNTIAVIVVSCVAFICLVLLASLLFVMRKRQTRFNYGERCRPVSLDAYSLDSVSAYNSVRRKGVMRTSKRSYGNPTFEDSSAIPSHPINFTRLSAFCNDQNAIYEEFISIPQVTAPIDELPNGAEIKNRYANVIPLPETRVSLMKINNDPLTEYINASYVRGPKNVTKYYIGCQAPMATTVIDFWRMIWEQQSRVIIMLTDLIENGVEKCAEYIPPSEVTDCHRLFGDFQVTLKKRETKEKYAISTLHLKNLENNTYREISHIWYLWPANGVQTDAPGLIAVLLEARAAQRGGHGPMVVHCSPGTGRTGTIIALDLAIRQYEITRTIDVPRVVYTIRRDRAGAVQTKEQYFFIYKALNFYATKLAGGGLEST